MSDFAQVGDAVILSKPFLQHLLNDAAKVGAKTAIVEFEALKSKQEKLTVKQVAAQEKCSTKTVISWINQGIKKGQLKLKANQKNRDYSITRHDLNEFLNSK